MNAHSFNVALLLSDFKRLLPKDPTRNSTLRRYGTVVVEEEYVCGGGSVRDLLTRYWSIRNEVTYMI